MEFEHRLRVRFQDVDAARIIFFSRYFEYAHTAYVEWLRVLGLPLGKLLDAAEVGLPLAHAEADFHSPARFDDELVVTVGVERLGQTSASFVFPITTPSGEKRATVRTTHVCIDTKTFRPTPWPDEIRTALAGSQTAG